MAVFFAKMDTSLETTLERKGEKLPEDKRRIGGSEKNCIFKPNSTTLKTKEFDVTSFHLLMKSGRRPAPGEGLLGG